MKLAFSLLLSLASLAAASQSVSTSVKFDKENKPALMLYLPYSQEVAEGTILTKLREIGFEPESKGSLFWKNNKVNGFYVFKGVVLKGEKNELVDLYFKVDRRGNKKDNQSVMYLLTSKGGNNFITAESDTGTFASAQKFLNGFTTETAAYKHVLDIQAQEEAVRKAEKKLADLVTDEKDLSNKIQKLQDDLAKNKQNQSSQQLTIEAEKKKLADMRAVKQ